MASKALSIDPDPVTLRPFLGLGCQTHADIFDDINEREGVDEEDYQLIFRRMRYVNPAIARMHVCMGWFEHLEAGGEPSRAYGALIRQLRCLKTLGARVNLVFQAPSPLKGELMEPAVERMVRFLSHLMVEEGASHIGWLALWNKPDHTFGHGSPLSERLVNRVPSPATWDDYVHLNRLAHGLMQQAGLAVKLVVADTVDGPLFRQERMELALKAFGDLDVAYSYHSYSSEGQIGSHANPDYFYHGMEMEARRFRELLGPERELVVWEFNTSGVCGYGHAFSGVGPQGEDRISSVRGAVEMADKVLSAMMAGVDGLSLWCLHDLYERGDGEVRLIEFGLWRFKHQCWYPRPLYHYYACLCNIFRPGGVIHRVLNLPDGIRAVAAFWEGKSVVAVLNSSERHLEVACDFPPNPRIYRVWPSQFSPASDQPFHLSRPAELGNHAVDLMLEPGELSIFSWGEAWTTP